MGLPDIASYGSPLFAEPMFLFGCALCNTSTYCMLTLWLSCVNYALHGEFPLLHRLLQDIFTYALFWLPRVCLSLKKQLPYYTISFSWNKHLLEPKLLCDECSVNLYNFFCEWNNTFLKWTEQKLQSFDWEKRQKAEGKMSPKILLEKNKERENRVSEEKERKRRKKKSNECTASFLFLLLFESPILAVPLLKNLALMCRTQIWFKRDIF